MADQVSLRSLNSLLMIMIIIIVIIILLQYYLLLAKSTIPNQVQCIFYSQLK